MANQRNFCEEDQRSSWRLRRRWGRCAPRFLIAGALLMIAESVAGHAIVVKSSLKEHPVTPNTPTTVTLIFSEKIQLPFTKVLLVSPHGDKRSLKLASGKHPAEVEVEVPALLAGRYVLRYNVLAIDGHFTEGVLRFQVAAPKKE